MLTRTDLALLAVAMVWGSSYLAAAAVVTPATVFAVLALRFVLAAAGLALLLAPRLRGITRDELVLGMVFGMVLAVVLAAETFGLTTNAKVERARQLARAVNGVISAAMDPRIWFGLLRNFMRAFLGANGMDRCAR